MAGESDQPRRPQTMTCSDAGPLRAREMEHFEASLCIGRGYFSRLEVPYCLKGEVTVFFAGLGCGGCGAVVCMTCSGDEPVMSSSAPSRGSSYNATIIFPKLPFTKVCFPEWTRVDSYVELNFF